MKNLIAGWLGGCALVGCAAPCGSGDVAEAPAALSPPPPDFVACSEAGDLVIASGATGAVREAVYVGRRIDDVVWDPWAGRVIVVEGDEDDEGGEIAAHAVIPGRRGPRFGARSHLAWLDGRARLLATPHGAVVFEESYGTRWKLLGAPPTASVIAPPPRSAWLTLRPGGAVVHAFGDGVRRVAKVTAQGIAPPTAEPLAATSVDAQLLPAPQRGGEALVDREEGALSVRIVQGAEVGEASLVPLASESTRIEAAVALQGGAVLVVLTSSPASLIALALGSEGAVIEVGHLPLPGEVPDAGPLVSRHLVVMGPRAVLAATGAGLFSAVITHGPAGIHVDPAPGFEGTSLRGPIAALIPSP